MTTVFNLVVFGRYARNQRVASSKWGKMRVGTGDVCHTHRRAGNPRTDHVGEQAMNVRLQLMEFLDILDNTMVQASVGVAGQVGQQTYYLINVVFALRQVSCPMLMLGAAR